MTLPTLALAIAAIVTAPTAGDYFVITIVDDQTGRGVPLVELRTVAGDRYVTDSAGRVAFYEPGLMGSKVFFYVASHGYESKADGFGFRGQALQVEAGGTAELRVHRTNIAERLYRVTGEGIYRDTVLAGREAPIENPVLNAQVVGSDSVNTAVYRGKIYWFWGDTNRVAYPLGTFHVPGATSRLPAAGGLDPRQGINLDYFQGEDGFVASTAEMSGEGPTWIDGVCVIRDGDRERMFAKYVKVRKFLEVYERGLVEFDDESKRFEKLAQFAFNAPLYPLGHSFNRSVDGTEYVFFGNPFPLVRVRADSKALADPTQYEAFTCLTAESRLDRPEIDRDGSGAPRFGWKRDTAALSATDEAKVVGGKQLKPGEALLALRDIETGKPVIAHAGSVAWNEFRKRWVLIAVQVGGTSYLGEVWFAEADTPLGPWVYARKVVTHDKYSFYNPKHHAMFDAEGGRRIYFEGTYAATFSGNDNPTPRYDYNQVMYSLDLADARLVLPVPVYQRVIDGQTHLGTGRSSKDVAFMALDRPGPGTVPVARGESASGGHHLRVVSEPASATGVAFYALPVGDTRHASTTLPLFEWRHPAKGAVQYAVSEQGPQGFVRAEKPLCRVWAYPITARVAWH